MKKTLTINLGGTVYHIDEDAYRLLDNYLTNLRVHFRREEGAEEIVHDMELRISELFTDRLNVSRQVVTIEDVEEIIGRMGKPEDLSGDETGEAFEERRQTGTTMRRLFRDPDDKILGGVASGLAAYMGWDVTWIRIILLVLGCFVHGVILAYIIAWIIVPLAHTAPEKLAMKGAAVNVENIGKTVTDGFEKVNDYMRSDRPRNMLQRIGDGIVSVAGFLIKFLLVLLAVCLAPVLFILLFVLFVLLMVATGLIAALPAVFYEVIPLSCWQTVGVAPTPTIALAVAGILVIGIPVIGMIHLLMRHFGGWQPMSFMTKIIFTLLWFIALGTGLFFILSDPNIASMISYSL
ncbi:PspC domain-containing protein [Phocaeicola sp.]|uniref:PspC domain-containing protein n=1 Tax=Phocaeicola sp. TaxID=2773926 RepID=UPI0023CAD0BF|nr:PspC domain-containing protein [Phocaeicola sp.]MDE5678302.1 PspC domain-containing protein [Phocaeicola sp.]